MWRKTVSVTALLALLMLVCLQPAAAQPGIASWRGEYYNNTFLLGTPDLVRQDAVLAFDWGTGSPAPGVINADGFAVRWGADPYFPAGTYRFWALADDEVRVNVGYAFTPQIDTFGAPKIGQVVYADVTLTEGVHHVQVDYREHTGHAHVYVTWANLATNPAGPNFPAPQHPVSVSSGPWTAQYYANPNLSGTPSLIQSEANLNHNWGAGSPFPTIPADNFSARWTSVQSLEAGTYQITVRVDDGVRVFVNGLVVIDKWFPADSAAYTTNINLPTGQHNFMVEYFEGTGNALIDFSLQRLGASGQPPQVVPPGPAQTTGTVTAYRLNVRSEPNASAAILTKIDRGQTYPVIAANANRSWWQINVNGTVGWVFGNFFSVANPQSVPTTGAGAVTQPPASTGYTVISQVTLNIRSLPGTSGAILGKLPPSTAAQVIGRNAASSWWQISYNGITGWVSATFAALQAGANINNIPVTG